MQQSLKEIVHFGAFLNDVKRQQIMNCASYFCLWFNNGKITKLETRVKSSQCNDFDNILICHTETDEPTEFYVISSFNPENYIYLRFHSYEHAEETLNDFDFLWALLWQRHKQVNDSAEWEFIFFYQCRVESESTEMRLEDIIEFEAESRAIIQENNVFCAFHQHDNQVDGEYSKLGFIDLYLDDYYLLEVISAAASDEENSVSAISRKSYANSPFYENHDLVQYSVNRRVYELLEY